jgi:Reverse transcriptase (RNA-dependent DNA polymerase)
VVSPLLANVYLHYVFDLWIEAWRQKVATGDVIVVRYADDLVVGFENRIEAERFLKAFRDRLAKFGLELHPEKTRLIEFGRFATRDREKRGEGKRIGHPACCALETTLRDTPPLGPRRDRLGRDPSLRRALEDGIRFRPELHYHIGQFRDVNRVRQSDFQSHPLHSSLSAQN